jgi:hypothetical protein
MQSSKGFPYSRVFRIMGFSALLIAGVISILNNPLSVNGLIIFAIGLFFFLFGFIGSLIFPNTDTISLNENEIILWNNSQNTEIPLDKIYKISGHSSFANQSGNTIDFYKIELTKNSNLDKPIFFKTNNEATRNFAHQLKFKWAKQKKR